MNRIGFSHGALYRVMDPYTKETFNIYAGVGSEIIEVCFAKAGEVEKLSDIIPFVEKYPYKSIHLPSDMKYRNDDQTRNILDKVSLFYNSIGADLILVHPDLVEDWSVFDDYPLKWAIENMDNRKLSYQQLSDLKKFFEQKNNWKMVLDLNHCFSNDKTMKLAEDFIGEFKDRIAEIHLSGFVDYHEPLYKTKQNIIMDFCKKIDVPIIIESTFDSVDEVEKEFEYISKYLK
jgi:hypothetical protein